ncbi:MAG: dipeptidase PepE [Cyclobacteriaceae bacterium]|nr:dipeptidase PepE [Cyclobacteriaceae bacterium]
MELLLLSNSTNVGEDYLAHPKKTIQEFLSANADNIVFIPYAGVSLSWDEYTDMVNKALHDAGLKVNPVHRHKDPCEAVENASAIMIGGGNSFHLLKLLYDHHLVKLIRGKVRQGIPYIGWSAGANMACPTLKTTNDMPIVEPPHFKALGLVDFQINPHYTEDVLPNHGGENRAMRIAEYIKTNPGSRVLGLPEGTMLRATDHHVRLLGDKGCKIFQYGLPSRWIFEDKELNDFLFNSQII